MSDYSSSPVALENVYELQVPLCLKSSDEMTAATKTDLKVFSLVSFRLFRNSATISLGGGRREGEEGGGGGRGEGGGRRWGTTNPASWLVDCNNCHSILVFG